MNGKQTSQHRLQDGDEIQIGPYTARFVAQPTEVAATTAAITTSVHKELIVTEDGPIWRAATVCVVRGEQPSVV